MPIRRRFLFLGHTQSTAPGLALNDLAGAAGRLDVLCRGVTAALCLSHGVRVDTEVWTVIDHDDAADGPRTLRWSGATLRNLNPDERSTAALFKKAFAHDAIEHLEEVHPGLEVAQLGFAEALQGFRRVGPVAVLDKDGHDVRGLDDGFFAADEEGAPGFVLSDHVPFTDAEDLLLGDLAPARVSVGPRWLHGHHAAVLVHDEMDRREATRR